MKDEGSGMKVEREALGFPPSSFRLQPSSFGLHPSAFILHPSAFILYLEPGPAAVVQANGARIT